MTKPLRTLAIALALLISQAHAARPEIVSQTQNDITITAQAMSVDECLDAFGKDHHLQGIFPIAFSIHNASDKAMTISSNHIAIPNTKILTPKNLESEIETFRAFSNFTTPSATTVLSPILLPIMLPFFVVTLPMNVVARISMQELETLRPIIYKHSASDTPITIELGATFKTIVFAKIDYPKDAEGKTPSYVVPKSLTMSVELRSNGWFDFNPSNTIELTIPTTVTQ